ncbi:putative pre-peptidase [Xenococcus sp. PCC 7305]|uniref:pre-peptidase C-terminal domain-containing protein n=1 Tax=Xenococcus sp. PCC 7305 TaxID=102125 RepID=UPI0002AC7EF0|nr:pre-peptidase C-terminal domain-containing protein [Xenococcus sp. PCC 7305]ELS01480.1 putative pre-peptidase [Xenococcus sp. PCC 7305]
MNKMSFHYTFSKISFLTIIFLSGFNNVGHTAIAEVETSHAMTGNILLSPKGLRIAQNEAASIATLENNITTQINRARESPSDYADWLEEQKQYYDGIMLKLPGEKPIRTNKGLQALEEAITFVRQQTPLSPLTYSEVVEIAAKEQLTPIADTNSENRRESRPQNISYGKVTAEAIVMQLVVDDGFRDRRHRLAIFSDRNQEVGISCREDLVYQQICAIAYAGNQEEISPTEELVVNEDSSPDPGAETPNSIVENPVAEIAPDITEPAGQETNQATSVAPEKQPIEENILEPNTTEDENVTPLASNSQPSNSLIIDKIERGFLEEGDKVIPNDGSFYDSYPLAVKAGESFVISLESVDFDTFLAIMDEEGNILEQNDDINENNSNSQLQVTIPNAGTYRLIVNAYDQGGKGAYILRISR